MKIIAHQIYVEGLVKEGHFLFVIYYINNTRYCTSATWVIPKWPCVRFRSGDHLLLPNNNMVLYNIHDVA